MSSSDNPLVDRQSIIVDRVQNTLNRDASALPPRQQGGERVMNPSEAEVVYTENREGYTRFVLTWHIDPSMALYTPTFRVYVNDSQLNVVSNSNSARMDTEAIAFDLYRYSAGPPCAIVLNGIKARRVLFKVQTQLANGFVSDLEDAPVASGFADPIEGEVKKVSANYTCSYGDRTIVVNATGGARTITLCNINDLPEGYTYTVKVDPADVSGNNVVVQGVMTSQTIDGAATNTMNTAGTARMYRADKTNAVWWLV